MPTTRILNPVIVDLPYTPMTISTGCHIVHLDHQNAKVLSSKFNPFLLCEIEWFLLQPIKNSKEWNVSTEILVSQQQLTQEY